MANKHKQLIKKKSRQVSQKPYLFGVLLNMLFIIGEIVFANIANSTALFADALHSISDVASLILAWIAVIAFGFKPSRKRTYGLHNATILASFINAILLLVAVGVIWYEAAQKLLNGGSTVQTNIVMWVAAIGIIINFVAAQLFAKSGQHKNDLNARGAYIHLLADAGVSLGVVASGFIISITKLAWLDPIVSIAIGGIILITSWDVFKQSLNLLVNGVPFEIDVIAIKNFLLQQAHIISLHDLHIWGLSTTETAMTVHLLVNENFNDYDLSLINDLLQTKFGIQHITVQVEKTVFKNEYDEI